MNIKLQDTETDITLSDEIGFSPETDDLYEDKANTEEKTAAWKPDPQFQSLYYYFTDMSGEQLFSARDERIVAARIKVLKYRASKAKKHISALKGRINNGNASETKKLQGRIRQLGVLSELYIRYSEQLKREFVKANLRLVVTIARRYSGRGLPLSDLIQEGNLGLIRAVEKFDHTKGFKFSTYAAWWIYQGISRALLQESANLKIPIYLLEQRRKVFETYKQLRKTHGMYPDIGEISSRTGLPVEAVRALIDSSNFTSLDVAVYDEDSGNKTTLKDIVEDEDLEPADRMVQKSVIPGEIQNAMYVLDEREKKVVTLRYGLQGDDPRTLEEIAGVFDLTKERIRQIQKRALEKIYSSEMSSKLRNLI